MSDKELEPDAWQDSEDAYYTYPSEKHPAGEDKSHIKRFQPLYSAETIQQRVEQAREEIHEEIREFQEEYRDVPYPVKDIIDEKLDKIVKPEPKGENKE